MYSTRKISHVLGNAGSEGQNIGILSMREYKTEWLNKWYDLESESDLMSNFIDIYILYTLLMLVIKNIPYEITINADRETCIIDHIYNIRLLLASH